MASKSTIWIIDDNQVNLLLLRRLSEKLEGVDVQVFDNPHKPLEVSETQLPQLIVLDHMMPAMDGLSFAKAFRGKPGCQGVPILMVTSSPDPVVKYELLALGLVDFLNKPVDAAEFLARVRNMLKLGSALNELSRQNEILNIAIDNATADLRERERESLLMLGRAAEYRDPETGGHIQRMAAYSELMARKLQHKHPYDPAEVKLAAPMHDLGKIGIPDAILLKPGPLDAIEWQTMKKHPKYGYDILKDSASRILAMGAQIAMTHHEAWDGTGYPQGLKGEQIPLLGRIVAVADIFDALTSVRPYKPAWSVEDAVKELRASAGKKLDPECVAIFLDSMDEILAIRERHKSD